MNLSYTEEQVMLREQIQKFCETEYDFYKREEVVKSENDFDANAWSLFAEQGWLSMPFSEESGGFGFGPIELSILFEEFGKSLVIEPYLSNIVLAGSILDKSNFDGKVELIENICSGSMHISLAYAEASHSYEYLKPDTNVSDDNKLNGTKTLVLNGKNASKLIVSCVKNGQFSLVLVDKSTEGVSFNSFKTIDEKTCSEFTFENVSIQDSDVIATGNEAKNLIKKLLILLLYASALKLLDAWYLVITRQFNIQKNANSLISQYQISKFYNIEWLICLLIVSLLNRFYLKLC